MFGETLGEGQFGLVLAATASNIAGLNGDTQVAVKMVRPGDQLCTESLFLILCLHDFFYLRIRIQ